MHMSLFPQKVLTGSRILSGSVWITKLSLRKLRQTNGIDLDPNQLKGLGNPLIQKHNALVANLVQQSRALYRTGAAKVKRQRGEH